METATLILLITFTLVTSDIVDYTRENYLLLENGNTALYNEYGTIFHVTNITYFENILKETESEINRNYLKITLNENDDDLMDPSRDSDITIIKSLLGQLRLTKRYKRGINEIGTVWKWISGSPDHDDLILIKNKLSELTINNNKQFVTNSEIFDAIRKLSKSIHKIENDGHLRLAKERNKLMLIELQNIVQTIALSKSGTLNPAILNLQDIREITKHEHGYMTITDLIDVSEFKIVQNEDLIVIFIKYPIIIKNCKLYEARAISQADGKLLINKEIAKCENEYINIQNCKIELRYTFCKLAYNETCLSNLLNNKKANCNKIREKNLDLEIIKDGAILLSGEHIVDNTTINGVYLISFLNGTTIYGKIYDNPTSLIQNYLKTYTIDKYEIENYIESLDENLKFNNINLIEQLQIEASNSPIITSFTLMVIIAVIGTSIVYYFKMRSSQQTNQLDLEEMRFSRLLKRVEELTEEAGRSS